MAKRVLIVEYQTEISAILESALIRWGYETVVVDDGSEAIRAFTLYQPDVVLVEILLPSLKGFDVCKSLKILPLGKDTPVILMNTISQTRKDSSWFEERCGADGYLEAPLTIQQLIKIVQNIHGKSVQGIPIARKILRWDLQKTSLSKIMNAFALFSATGSVRFTKNNIQKTIYFRNGNPCSATSNAPEDQLKAFVARTGLLTKEAEKWLNRQPAGHDLMQGLVDAGFLDPDRVPLLKKQAIREMIYSLSLWSDGFFTFASDDPEGEHLSETIDDSPIKLLKEGISRTFSEDRLKSVLGKTSKILVLAEHPLYSIADLSFSKEELLTIDLCDGTRSIDEVLSQSSLPKLQTMKLLVVLISLRMLKASIQKKRATVLSEYLSELKAEDNVRVKLAKQKLQTEYDRLKQVNFFERLHLNPNANRDEITAAYREHTNSFHPSLFLGPAFADIHDTIGEVVKLALEAYQTLIDEKQRRLYLQKHLGQIDIDHSEDAPFVEHIGQEEMEMLEQDLFSSAPQSSLNSEPQWMKNAQERSNHAEVLNQNLNLSDKREDSHLFMSKEDFPEDRKHDSSAQVPYEDPPDFDDFSGFFSKDWLIEGSNEQAVAHKDLRLPVMLDQPSQNSISLLFGKVFWLIVMICILLTAIGVVSYFTFVS